MYPTGIWYNELGSQMQLTISGNNVWGWYYSAVGKAIQTYPLSGQINTQPYPSSTALGWAVAWTNSYSNAHSVTAWSGQYQTIDGSEEIIAFWLLTSEMQDPADDWEATQVGRDVFTRHKPPEDQIENARRRQAKSHPSEET